MQWLTDFQQSFREPVFALLATSWPALAVLALVGAGWWFADATRRGSTSADTVFDSDADGDGDGDGGDGGGDGGGGD